MESPRESLSRITKETRRELEKREEESSATLELLVGGGIGVNPFEELCMDVQGCSLLFLL